jgi:PTS system nitrogen regulatory IIA component
MALVDYCLKEAILCDLEVSDKEDGIRQIVHALAAAKAFPKTKAKSILSEIVDRERQATTGIGNGVGVPHARSQHAKKVVMGIGRVAGGIDFGAVDGERVRVILVLVSPEKSRADHLAAMKSIVQIVRDPYQCKRLHGCDTPESFLGLLSEISP